MSERLGWFETVRAGLDELPRPAAEGGRTLARRLAGLAGISLVAAFGSLLLGQQPGAIATLWFANAPVAACLVHAPRRQWPAWLAAAVAGLWLAHPLAGQGPAVAFGFVLPHALEILLAAVLMQRAGLGVRSLRTPRALLKLLALGALLPQAAAAAATALLLGGGGARMAQLAQSTLEGHAIGALATLPLAMLIAGRPWAQTRHELRSVHLGWLLPLAIGLALLATSLLPFPFVYIGLPLLAAAMLVEFAALALLTLVVALVVGLTIGTGLFVLPPATARWEEVFVFLAFGAALIPAQLLGAAVTALRDSHARLAARSAELRRANEGLEQFVRIASHDLREPLNTVVQFTALVEADHGADLPPPARRYLGLVQRAATRMRALLDDMLQYTRTRREARPPAAPVALDAVLDEVRQSLAARLHDSGAELQVAPLPAVEGHATLLVLLFQNLLANALKFVAPGRRPQVVVTARDDGEQVRVQVQDNGIGIAEADLPRLFQPFQRLHLRRQYEGSGLGLALCREIAELHGGRIEVRSAPGEGACFTVTLPAARG